MAGFQLGIDFGTSHTVAMLRWPDGRTKPLLFDGTPLLPSAVFVDESGGFAVGRDALDSARLHPSRLEPNPKRRVDESTVLLGTLEVGVPELIGAVLSRVGAEAYRIAGTRPSVVTLTCPAAWGTPRRRVLLDAAARVGLGEVRLVEEPVAAATYFASVLGHAMAPGSAVVVYDFGGGTFDVSLVERTAGGFRTRAVAGRDDIGGLDLDEVLVGRIGEVYGPIDPAGWQRLSQPAGRADRRLRRMFRDDVRSAKERLSRQPTAAVHVPVLEREAHLTREEFETLAAPLLRQTVRMTSELIAGFPRDRIAGVFLVGGGSRIPLIATLVHAGLNIPPTVIEQPELVVGEGSLLVGSVVALSRAESDHVSVAPTSGAATAYTASSAVPVSSIPVPVSPAPSPVSALPAPVSAPPTQVPSTPVGPLPPVVRPSPPQVPPPTRRRAAWIAAAVAVVVLLSGGAAAWYVFDPFGSKLPVACQIAGPSTAFDPLPAGNPPAEPKTAATGWQDYQDPSGFRMAYPPGLRQIGTGACFGDTAAGRYLAVGQWRQPDTDLVAYLESKRSEVESGLGAYVPGKISKLPAYFAGAAQWEFGFDDGDRQMHATMVAFTTADHRGYSYLWVTREDLWSPSLEQFRLIPAVFQPAT